jgi:hypothetical protein
MKRLTRFLLFTTLLAVIGSAFAFAGDTTAVAINSLTTVPTQSTTTLFVTILAPIVVYGATWLVGFLVPRLPSVLITTLVVPTLSGITVLIANLLGSTNPWYIQFALGLAATFVHEFQNNVKQATPPAVPPVIPVPQGLPAVPATGTGKAGAP